MRQRLLKLGKYIYIYFVFFFCLFVSFLQVLTIFKRDQKDKDKYTLAAIHLLNQRPREFNLCKVLTLLPNEWSVNMIGEFLKSSLRLHTNTYRETEITKNLTLQQVFRWRSNRIMLSEKNFFVHAESICVICNQVLSCEGYIRFPSGVLTHIHCFPKHQLQIEQ
eukprot:Sdes_comp16021_c0_seq1m5206